MRISDWSSDVCSSDLTVASHLALKIPEKQELLESETVSDRLEKVYAFMEGEIGVLQVEKRIRNRVKRQMEKTQREYYLNEQLKAIQKELFVRSEEHTSELQSLMRISYAVFCLKKKK